MSPVDGLCLPELTSTSVAELLLNDLPAAESTYVLSVSPQHSFSNTSVCAKSPASKTVTDDILMPSYSSLPLPADVDGLLSNTTVDDLQSLLHVTKLSSDVMLTDDRHSLLLPAADLDALDTLQLVGTCQQTPACELYADDFLFDDADWSSVQVMMLYVHFSNNMKFYIKQSCLNSDLYIYNTVAANLFMVHLKILVLSISCCCKMSSYQ